MKAVLLAGGFGTRLSEETQNIPKPLLPIGGMPILWHIMKIYAHHGISDFVICLGYKGYLIKEYFYHLRLHQSDLTIELATGKTTWSLSRSEPWTVSLVDTGLETMTGGRIKRIRDYVGDETFLLTYGDGVADIDITATIAAHRQFGKMATVTAVQQPSRFGAMSIDDSSHVTHFREKSSEDGAWINGGFFVLEPSVFDYIEGDQTIWEREPMERIATDGELTAYKHKGFWLPMDTLRDKNQLEALWASGKAPWKIWT